MEVMNMERKTKLARLAAAWLAVCALCLPLLLGSCGDDEYEKPLTTQTPTALISPATLRAWADAGLVNGEGFDRVLVLNADSLVNYNLRHIPGALLLNSATLYQERIDGVASSRYEIPAGAAMDALIQSLGISGNTTLVFTGTSMLTVARAYFTFRYWGFPKNRLKLLDGLNGCPALGVCVPVAGSWANLYGLTPPDDPSPAIAPSTYSVRNNDKLRNDLRLALSEMIDYAEGRVPNAVAIDGRTPNPGSYQGIRASTGSNFAPATDYMVFEGRIRGAKALAYTTLYNSTTNFYNSDATNIAAFATVGLDSTKTAYIYCRFGFMGSVTFFVLDGILGWPAAFYDGSWAQWGQLSGNASMHGQLAADSPWRTDIPSRSELIVYNNSLISEPAFFGTGLNDLASAGSSATNYRYVVEIDGAGTPDTFRWSSDGGTTWTASLVSIDGNAQALGATGVTITFAATTGHTGSDSWIFTSGPRVAVEQYTADGGACSIRYNVDGTMTDASLVTGTCGGIPSVCECTNLPNSYDTSGNRMEAEDIEYMKAGSGGSGSGSGEHGGC
jgi:thiosulfate/3-mercaptopyruvate sulfurtransferase